MTATKPRYRRQRVTREDGTVAVQTKPPRADVLWYPRSGYPTVLVRRTHDVEMARAMAERRWLEVGDGRPLADAVRIGWFLTYSSSSPVPDDAAEDSRGRVVRHTRDDRAHGVGPGVEFRPEAPEETRQRVLRNRVYLNKLIVGTCACGPTTEADHGEAAR